MTRVAALAAVTLLALACDRLTSVAAPDVVQPEDYGTVAGASALAVGAITQFNLAFGGAIPTSGVGQNQVMQSAQISDELFGTSQSIGEIEWDKRDANEPAEDGGVLYIPLHRARINILTAIAALQRNAPDSTARIGQLFALLAYSELFLGENFCSGISLGKLDADFRPEYGDPLNSQQLFERSVADFDSALAYARDSIRIINLARVGKGRVLVNLARFPDAAQAVSTVPTSYIYNATFISGTLHNGVYALGTNNWFTVPEREGINGINWRTANDPRVPLVNRSPALRGLDGVTQIWVFAPYQASNAPIRLAGGVEARLIEAEAALQAGNTQSWLSIHNTLRATVPGLSALADPGTPAGRVDLHFRERAFWLFLTGHRHGDLRRLVRHYGRSSESILPTGIWREGVSYGGAVSSALPSAASNNPKYVGCLDRAA